MKRVWWMKHVGFCLVVVAMLTTTAWAAGPTGAANLHQVLDGGTTIFSGGEVAVTFLANQNILFRATYYDPSAACDGVAATFVQLFLFTQGGDVVQQFDAASFTFTSPGFSKYQSLEKSFSTISGIPLSPGSYRWTFLVRDCTSSVSVVLPEFLTFSVSAP